jgi:predicted MFS family arabinose efflux permease
LQVAWQNRGLRRLVVEAAAFEGAFRSGRDYLQPVLQQAALALPLLGALEEGRRSAVLIGVVYAALYLLSSVAARKSHRFATRFGGETTASGKLWLGLLMVYLLMIPAFSLSWTIWLVLSFLTLGVAQNLWRPMIISRFHGEAPEGREATILSIESQAGSLATVVLAPLLGLLADQVGFAGVGMIGSLLAGLVLMLFYGRRHGQAE